MRHFGLRSPLIRYSCLSLATLGLVSLPVLFAQASTRVQTVDYQFCADSLLAAGIANADAAAACAAALYPQDLAQCVMNIDQGTEIAATDALAGCRRVRRPLELATCVNEIDNSAAGTDPLIVLDNCRRSLLPTRFSACVVGLNREIGEFPVATAMQTCLAAGNRPRNVLPSFIPAGQTPPSAPPVSPNP